MFNCTVTFMLKKLKENLKKLLIFTHSHSLWPQGSVDLSWTSPMFPWSKPTPLRQQWMKQCDLLTNQPVYIYRVQIWRFPCSTCLTEDPSLFCFTPLLNLYFFHLAFLWAIVCSLHCLDKRLKYWTSDCNWNNQ